MGEAKRRKQLGLMPTIHPFEVLVAEQNEVTLVRAPASPERREQILAQLHDFLERQLPWARKYRREYVMAGRPQKLLRTAADVEAIEVPRYRRLLGEVLENYNAREGRSDLSATLKTMTEYLPLDEAAQDREAGGRGTWLHVREEFSFDGKQWQSFTDDGDLFERMRYLMQHPVSELQGNLVATYQSEQDQDGEIRFDPEPPAEQRAELEEFLRDWNGKTPEDWASHFHEAQNTPNALEAYTPVPRSIRNLLELRESAPMPGFMNIAVSSVGEYGVYLPHEQRTYTLDGETWLPYEVERPEDNGDEIIYTITLHSDGRIEWDEDDFTLAQKKMLRAVIPAHTGAGDPASWAQRMQELILDVADGQLAVPEGQHLPVPQQVKFDISDELWWMEEEKRDWSIMLSEVTFDGEHWRDIYADEWPPELEPFAVPEDQTP